MLSRTAEHGQEPPHLVPPDVLPYYFAVEPSPAGARCLFAVAMPLADGTGVGVSIMLEDRGKRAEIFRFSQLGFVRIAWSPCGDFLAFAQGSTLMVRDPDGTLRLDPLVEDVRWLGFDSARRLWCLAGGRLEVRFGQRVQAGIDQVECAVAGDVGAYCRCVDAGWNVYLHDGTRAREFARLPDLEDQVSVDLSLRGRYLVVTRAAAKAKDRALAQIIRCDMETSEMQTLMEERVAFGFNGGPGIDAKALDSGEVLAAYESETCTQIWTLAPGASAQPISPDGYEVFDFAVDADGSRIAVVASDTRSAAGVFDRQLLIGRRGPEGWRFSPAVPGVHEMPRWRHDGRLETLCGRRGRWTCFTHDPDAGTPNEGFFLAEGREDYDLMRLAGSQSRRAGIVLLPRLHQQFVAGAQSFFFHHLLFSAARGLASAGYTVVVINGPGAIGKGRPRREPAHSYLTQLRSAVDDVTQLLQAEGCLSIGVLAGSLAAVPALRFCGPGTPFSACAFVTPLFEASIPVTRPARHYLLDDSVIESLDVAARKMEVPALIVHGARDEVVPSWQIARFSELAGRPGVEICVLEDEGHIFKRPESWRRMQDAIENFFASHLTAGKSA